MLQALSDAQTALAPVTTGGSFSGSTTSIGAGTGSAPLSVDDACVFVLSIPVASTDSGLASGTNNGGLLGGAAAAGSATGSLLSLPSGSLGGLVLWTDTTTTGAVLDAVAAAAAASGNGGGSDGDNSIVPDSSSSSPPSNMAGAAGGAVAVIAICAIVAFAVARKQRAARRARIDAHLERLRGLRAEPQTQRVIFEATEAVSTACAAHAARRGTLAPKMQFSPTGLAARDNELGNGPPAAAAAALSRLVTHPTTGQKRRVVLPPAQANAVVESIALAALDTGLAATSSASSSGAGTSGARAGPRRRLGSMDAEDGSGMTMSFSNRFLLRPEPRAGMHGSKHANASKGDNGSGTGLAQPPVLSRSAVEQVASHISLETAKAVLLPEALDAAGADPSEVEAEGDGESLILAAMEGEEVEGATATTAASPFAARSRAGAGSKPQHLAAAVQHSNAHAGKTTGAKGSIAARKRAAAASAHKRHEMFQCVVDSAIGKAESVLPADASGLSPAARRQAVQRAVWEMTAAAFAAGEVTADRVATSILAQQGDPDFKNAASASGQQQSRILALLSCFARSQHTVDAAEAVLELVVEQRVKPQVQVKASAGGRVGGPADSPLAARLYRTGADGRPATAGGAPGFQNPIQVRGEGMASQPDAHIAAAAATVRPNRPAVRQKLVVAASAPPSDPTGPGSKSSAPASTSAGADKASSKPSGEDQLTQNPLATYRGGGVQGTAGAFSPMRVRHMSTRHIKQTVTVAVTVHGKSGGADKAEATHGPTAAALDQPKAKIMHSPIAQALSASGAATGARGHSAPRAT